jgi:apolipoprotein N-acyltransferase
VLTHFGLAAVLSCVGCLWLPIACRRAPSQWLGLTIATSALATLWWGGIWIESLVTTQAPPIAVLLVQPAGASGTFGAQQELWKSLETLTRESLDENPTVDLIIWPESCLAQTPYADSRREDSHLELTPPATETGEYRLIGNEFIPDRNLSLNLTAFRLNQAKSFLSNCLVGVCLSEPAIAFKYGQVVRVEHSYNCACLVSPDGNVRAHEKLAAMPFREGLPGWMDCNWVRQVLDRTSIPGNLDIQRGRNFDTMTFVDTSGFRRKIAVAICYESWLPWLPQYHCEEPLDAICHLAYDGDFKDHPEYTQRMLLTIRLRAIETRTWQLVCSHYAGTAVIDPRGRIVKQLPPGPGVLRTDQL